jgi:putative tricarboxylic transport membrane protein
MLGTLSVSFFTTPLLGGSPVSYRDFTPIAAIAMSPYVMAVRAASPLKTLADIKGRARLTTGTTGAGSDAVLLANMLQNESHVRVDSVPFDGEGEIMTATLGGHVDFLFGNPGEILPQIEAGTLRPLAVSTGQRLSSLPDVPTFKELGYNIEHVQLRGVVMPGDMPPQVVAKWEQVLRTVAESPEWKTQYLDRFKEEPYFVPGKEFAQVIERTNRLYETMLTELGFIEP